MNHSFGSSARKLSVVCTLGLALNFVLFLTTPAHGQTRGKRPDRGTYQAPVLQDLEVEQLNGPPSLKSVRAARAPKLTPVTTQPVLKKRINAKWGAPLVDASIETVEPGQEPVQLRPAPKRILEQPVVDLTAGPAPVRDRNIVQAGAESVLEMRPSTVVPTTSSPAPLVIEDSYPASDCMCDACTGGACDSIGCDSMGCSKSGGCPLGFGGGNWFGSVELLLMFRRGDRPPPLVTTGSDADAETAGELGDASTQILAGNDSIFKDMEAGGRLELGMWLNSYRTQSLVFRGWFAGKERYSFAADASQFNVLARPFFNVSDGQAAAQDTTLLVFPDRSTGGITISGDSNVYGADISVRQLSHGQYGGTIDLLYGYQFMRMDENLAIASSSTSLDDNFAPVGSVIQINDAFDVENEFHGGQIGLATMYREDCWSFRSLVKTGFGSLRRRARLSGQTTTSVDDVSAIDANGLLVRSTNQGTYEDNTFGWVPELDFTIGWHRFPSFDVTFGYHIIGMTDALRVSGAMDPALQVNLSDPITGQASPAANLSFETFYVQGIHFGLQYVY